MSAAAIRSHLPADDVDDVDGDHRARHPSPSTWRSWRKHFCDNILRRQRLDGHIPWAAPVGLSADQRRVWVASLQKFQVGESGDGLHLLDRAARADAPDYLECARSFVAEEQSHAHLLAALLERLGAPTIEADWTDALFVRARRLMGVSTELAVIQVAEGVALVYYGTLARGAPDPAIRAAAARILGDEEAHVRFHTDRIREDLARWPWLRRTALRALWWGGQLGATAVVALDHRRALADAGLPPRAAVSAVWRSVGGIRRATYA